MRKVTEGKITRSGSICKDIAMIESFNEGPFTVELRYDEDPINPRGDYDNLSVIATWHRRYSIGDVQPKEDRTTYYRKVIPKSAFVYDIFMYDHSGIALSLCGNTYPFNDRWDAGWLGWAWVSRKKAKECFGAKYTEKQVRAVVEGELHSLEQYVNGVAYGYKVLATEGEEVHSCWGFDDLSYCKESARAEAVAAAKSGVEL